MTSRAWANGLAFPFEFNFREFADRRPQHYRQILLRLFGRQITNFEIEWLSQHNDLRLRRSVLEGNFTVTGQFKLTQSDVRQIGIRRHRLASIGFQFGGLGGFRQAA